MFHTLDLPPHLTFLWLLLSRTSSGKNKSKGNVSGDYNSLLQSSWLPPTRKFHDVNEKWGRNCPRSGSRRCACFPVGMEPIKHGCRLIWILRAKMFILVMWSTVAAKWFLRLLGVSVGAMAVWGVSLRKEIEAVMHARKGEWITASPGGRNNLSLSLSQQRQVSL